MYGPFIFLIIATLAPLCLFLLLGRRWSRFSQTTRRMEESFLFSSDRNSSSVGSQTTAAEGMPNVRSVQRPSTTHQQEMGRMKRGVGYCENTDCEDYSKGVFLLNHGDTFYCPRCRQLGKVEKERGFYTGNSDIFKEVRVEYNFDPAQGIYREIGIVRDESLWGRNNVYTLQSPLIKTEKRALKVAESILANLNRYRGILSGDEIPRQNEEVISFDDDRENFDARMRRWEQDLRSTVSYTARAADAEEGMNK